MLLWSMNFLAWTMSLEEITEDRMCLYCSIFCLWSEIAEALAKVLSMAPSLLLRKVEIETLNPNTTSGNSSLPLLLQCLFRGGVWFWNVLTVNSWCSYRARSTGCVTLQLIHWGHVTNV